MNWHFVVRFLHITTAIIFIGGIFARQLVRSYAKKTDDIQIFTALSQAAGRIESLMVLRFSGTINHARRIHDSPAG